MFFNFCIFFSFSNAAIDFCFHDIVIVEDTWYNFYAFIFIKAYFVQIWSILDDVPLHLRMYTLFLLSGMFQSLLSGVVELWYCPSYLLLLFVYLLHSCSIHY